MTTVAIPSGLLARCLPPLAALGVALATLQATRGAPLLALLLVVVLATAWATTRPRACVLAVVALGVTVLPARQFSLGGLKTDHIELLVGLLVGTWLLERAMQTREQPSSAFAVPLGLLLAGALVGGVVGTLAGSPGVLGPFKTYCFYLLALPIGAAYQGVAGRAALVRALCRIADVGCALVLANRFLGLPLPFKVQTTVVTLGETSRAQRLLPPLQALLMVVALLVVARLAASVAERGDVLRLGVYTLVLLLGFTRSAWVPLAVVGLLLSLGHRGPRQPLRALKATLALVAVCSTLLVAGSAGALGTTGHALTRRVSSVVDADVRQDATYRDRQEENDAALRTLRGSPIVGVGLGRGYGLRRAIYLDNPPRVVMAEHSYIHNSALFTWLQLGLLGIAAMVALGVVATRCARKALVLPPEVAAHCLGGAGALLAFGLQSLFQPSLLHRPTIICVALAMVLADPVGAEEPTSDGADGSP